MIIEYIKIDSKRIKVMKITSKDGKNVDSFGYTFNDVQMKQYEILSEKYFKNKINRIRKCEKIVSEEEGKVQVVRYRSDKNDL